MNRVYLDYLGNIASSGHHLLTVIDDILELAQLEAGKVPLHEEAIDLGEVVDQGIEAVRGVRHPLYVVMVNTIDARTPRIWADRRALCQMVRHIVDNAVKFSHSGGQVTVSVVPTPGGGVEVRIADCGAGIAPERLELLFEPFQPGNTMVARSSRGVGLGLPIASLLMRLHEGEIVLASKRGVGTVVSLRFPARRVMAGVL